MWECPKCGTAVENTLHQCWACGTFADGTVYPVDQLVSDLLRSEAAGMPRRFGVGKLMAITALFAVLFGLMKWADFHPIAFPAVGVFVGVVGVAQALLFGGKKPRLASMLAGAVLFPFVGAGTYIIVYGIEGRRLALEACLDPGALAGAGILGVIFGYLAGGLVAGLFLGDARDRDRKDDSAA